MHIWDDDWPYWDEFDSLLNRLDRYLAEHDIRPADVKEKFGTLRIYSPYVMEPMYCLPNIRIAISRYRFRSQWNAYQQRPKGKRELIAGTIREFLSDLIRTPLTLWRMTPVHRWIMNRKYDLAVLYIRAWLTAAVQAHPHLATELLCCLEDDLVGDLLDAHTCAKLKHPCTWVHKDTASCHICGESWPYKRGRDDEDSGSD